MIEEAFMQKEKQTTIERTLIIGAILGLIIGIVSKRVAVGLLIGIALSFVIAVFLRDTNRQNERK